METEDALESCWRHATIGFTSTSGSEVESFLYDQEDIARKISTEVEASQVLVAEVIQRTLDSIIDFPVSEGRIELRGFAVFEVVVRKGRTARNPRTGEPVAVPTRPRVKFTSGREMTRKVQEDGVRRRF